MRSYHSGSHRFLSLRSGALSVALVAITLVASGAPLASGASSQSALQALRQPAMQATSSAPQISSKVTLGDASIDGPALWTSNPSGSSSGVASVLAWTGTDPSHSLNLMPSSD